MHYLNGTEAMVGDAVFGRTTSGVHPVVGIVVETVAGTDTCNILVAFVSGAIPLNQVGVAGKDYRLATQHNLVTEYGNTNEFELLYRNGAEFPNRFQAQAVAA